MRAQTGASRCSFESEQSRPHPSPAPSQLTLLFLCRLANLCDHPAPTQYVEENVMRRTAVVFMREGETVLQEAARPSILAQHHMLDHFVERSNTEAALQQGLSSTAVVCAGSFAAARASSFARSTASWISSRPSGGFGAAVYFVLSGQLSCSKAFFGVDRELEPVGAGHYFGDVESLHPATFRPFASEPDQPQLDGWYSPLCTYRATAATVLLALPVDVFRRLALQDPYFTRLRSYVASERTLDILAQVISISPLFEDTIKEMRRNPEYAQACLGAAATLSDDDDDEDSDREDSFYDPSVAAAAKQAAAAAIAAVQVDTKRSREIARASLTGTELLSPYRFFHQPSMQATAPPREMESADVVIRALLPLFELQRVPAGSVIVRQGAPPDEFFVILHGSARITKRDAEGDSERLLFTTRAGDWFGELGVLKRQNRTASVWAAADADMLLLRTTPSGLQTALCLGGSRLRDTIDNAMISQMGRTLSRIPLFEGLDAADLRQFAQLFRFRDVPVPGTIVCAQDRPAPGFFIVLHGQVEEVVESIEGSALHSVAPLTGLAGNFFDRFMPGGDLGKDALQRPGLHVGVATENQHFGEESLLGFGVVPSAASGDGGSGAGAEPARSGVLMHSTFRALSPCVLLFADPKQFEQLLVLSPALSAKLEQTAQARAILHAARIQLARAMRPAPA